MGIDSSVNLSSLTGLSFSFILSLTLLFSFLFSSFLDCQYFFQPISCMYMKEVGKGGRLIQILESQEKKHTLLIQLHLKEKCMSKLTLQQ